MKFDLKIHNSKIKNLLQANKLNWFKLHDLIYSLFTLHKSKMPNKNVSPSSNQEIDYCIYPVLNYRTIFKYQLVIKCCNQVKIFPKIKILSAKYDQFFNCFFMFVTVF